VTAPTVGLHDEDAGSEPNARRVPPDRLEDRAIVDTEAVRSDRKGGASHARVIDQALDGPPGLAGRHPAQPERQDH
jgi:hypothetical protein